MDSQFPERIGPYPPERLIGRGAMAAVYLSRDRSGQAVAVKWMDQPHAPLVDRFEREIEILARLQHPHIVRFRDSGSWLGRPYLVTDYIEGTDLRLLTPKLHQRPAAERYARCREIGGQLCKALEHLHARGIVHRDVKPANVLVDTDGRAVLSDFGVIKELDTDERTAVGLVVGTVAFAAPEQLEGGCVDARTDLFGLGGTLYYLLTGRRPYDGPSRQQQALPPSRFDPGVPPDLESVVLRLMALDSAHRPLSARAAGRALAAGQPTAPLWSGPLPVAGQQEALTLLARALDHAADGRGVWVHLHGPRGVGSAWLEEVVGDQARRRGLPLVGAHDNTAVLLAVQRLTAGERLVVVSPERPSDPGLPEEIELIELELAPLGPADMRRTLVGLAPATPDRHVVATELYRASGGLADLFRPLLEAGVADGCFSWPDPAYQQQLGVAFLGERSLDELDVLGALALSPRPLSTEVLEAAAGVPGDEPLEALAGAGLVRGEQGRWWLGAELLREAVLAALPDPDGLAGRLGRAVGTEPAAGTVPGLPQADAALLAGQFGAAHACLLEARAAAGPLSSPSGVTRLTTRLGDLLRIYGDFEAASRLLADASALARAAELDESRQVVHALRALTALESRPGRKGAAAAALDRVMPLASRVSGREHTAGAALLQAVWALSAAVLRDRRTRTRAAGRALHQAHGLPLRVQGVVWLTVAQAAQAGRDQALFTDVLGLLEASGSAWLRLEAAALRGRSGPARAGAALLEIGADLPANLQATFLARLGR